MATFTRAPTEIAAIKATTQTAQTASTAAASKVAATAAFQIPISINIEGDQAAPPAILRGGTQVVPPTVITTQVEAFVGGLVPIARLQVPRVLSQSVPANTRVAIG